MAIVRNSLPSLLILPPPPTPSTAEALKAAYYPSLTGAIKALTSSPQSSVSVLQVFISFPGLYHLRNSPRSRLFKQVEHLVARLYSLISIICVRNGIEPDGPGGVDSRVIILTYDQLERPNSNADPYAISKMVSGPIVDYATLALTRRHWRYIFCVDGEHGEKSYSLYLNLASETNPPVQGEKIIIAGGISIKANISHIGSFVDESAKHLVVAVGGTFDHLHAGHKLLLTATALLLQPTSGIDNTPRRLIVGITGDELLRNKKYAEYLQTWKKRQDNVVEFLLSILYFTRPGTEDLEIVSINEPVVNGTAIHTTLKQAGITIECVEIQDPYGPTITDETITALAVSGETRSGGAAVNAKREEKGWRSLEIFEVDVLDAEDDTSTAQTENFDSKISSTAIRKRKADNARGSSL
jgi:phosphopantetheine adenylyltransferase